MRGAARKGGPYRDQLNSYDVLRVVEACDGLPLAMRELAPRVRNTRRDAAELAGVLEHPATVWAELGGGVRSVRHTLQARLDALPEGPRRTLAFLALHPAEEVAVYPASWLTGGTPRAVESDFAELQARGLITISPAGRARTRRLVGHLAADAAVSLGTGVSEEALRRLIAGYVAAAMAADQLIVAPRYRPPKTADGRTVTPLLFAGRAQAAEWCRAEADVIPQLCALALQLGFDEDCWRLAYAMRDYFFDARATGPWVESHRIALRAAERSGGEWEQAVTRNNLGMALAEQGHLVAATGQYRRALKLMDALADDRGVATTLGHLAWARHATGRHNSAVAIARRARHLNQQHDNMRALAIVDRTAALAYSKLGRYREALYLLAECQEVLSGLEFDLPLDISMTDNCLGEVYLEMGYRDKAADHYSLVVERGADCGGAGELTRATRGLAAAGVW